MPIRTQIPFEGNLILTRRLPLFQTPGNFPAPLLQLVWQCLSPVWAVGQIMYEILPWIGLAILFVLCLPIRFVQRFVLEVSTWVLRLGAIALLVGGVYLWFRPGELPAGIASVLNNNPSLFNLLPAPGSRAFGVCLVCWAVTMLVPLIAVLDVARRHVLAVHRIVAVESREEVLPVAEPVEEVGVPILRPVERRRAAAVLASAGSRTTR